MGDFKWATLRWATLGYPNIIYYILYYLLISLSFRTKQVIKVMRAKDKGGKKIGSNKYK